MSHMIDRFLVRAKDIDTGWWVEGCYVRDISKENRGGNLKKFAHTVTPATYAYAPAHPVDPNTLCQKTGFQVGGKPIWENDIVEVIWHSGRTEKYLMWWCREMSMMSAVSLEGIQFNGHDYWNSPHHTYDDFALMMQDPWGDIKSVEVIGNLFDTPELLHNKEEEKDGR